MHRKNYPLKALQLYFPLFQLTLLLDKRAQEKRTGVPPFSISKAVEMTPCWVWVRENKIIYIIIYIYIQLYRYILC